MKAAKGTKPTGAPEMPGHICKALQIEPRTRQKARTADVGDDGLSASSFDDSETDDDNDDSDDDGPGTQAASQRTSALETVPYARPSRGKNMEKTKVESSDWAKPASTPRTRFDTSKALAALLDPQARADQVTASIEQRTSSALALQQIQDLQATIRLRDMKIERLEDQLRIAEKANHALERTADSLRMELRFLRMLPAHSMHASPVASSSSFPSDAAILPGNAYQQPVTPLRLSAHEPLTSSNIIWGSSSPVTKPNPVEFTVTLSPSKRNKNKDVVNDDA